MLSMLMHGLQPSAGWPSIRYVASPMLPRAACSGDGREVRLFAASGPRGRAAMRALHPSPNASAVGLVVRTELGGQVLLLGANRTPEQRRDAEWDKHQRPERR